MAHTGDILTNISGSADEESACNAGDLGSTLGWEDPLEKGLTTPSSILAWRIPMDRGAWRATVYGVSDSDTPERLALWLIHVFLQPKGADRCKAVIWEQTCAVSICPEHCQNFSS